MKVSSTLWFLLERILRAFLVGVGLSGIIVVFVALTSPPFLGEVTSFITAVTDSGRPAVGLDYTDYPSGNPLAESLTAGYVEGLEILDRLILDIQKGDVTIHDRSEEPSLGFRSDPSKGIVFSHLDDGELEWVEFVYHGEIYVTIAPGRPATICQEGRCLELVWSDSEPYHFEIIGPGTKKVDDNQGGFEIDEQSIKAGAKWVEQ